MQGIYNYIPQTNHISRVYSVVPVLYLQLVLHVMLFHLLNMLRLLLSLLFITFMQDNYNYIPETNRVSRV